MLEIKTPEGIVLAAEYHSQSVHELEGDLAAFKLVDLDAEGLADYRAQLVCNNYFSFLAITSYFQRFFWVKISNLKFMLYRNVLI